MNNAGVSLYENRADNRRKRGFSQNENEIQKILVGFMAVATLASVIIQPVAVSASELEPEEIPFEQQYAELKTFKIPLIRMKS